MSNHINQGNVFFGTVNKYGNVLFIVFILLLNIIIKGLYLDANPIELDEPFSIFYAQMEIREIISGLKYGNNPPLYEIFLHFWIKIFGISPFAVRFPSLLFSVLNVYFIYLISNHFFNSRVVILSVILTTFSNYHLFFSHEARVYPLFALLTTISFYLLFLIIGNKNSNYNLFLLFITYAGLVFSHYFGIFVVAFQAVLILRFAFRKTVVLKRYFFIILCLLFSYAYYIPIVINRFIDSSQRGTWLKPVENIGNMFDLIFLFSNSSKWVYLIVIISMWGAAWKFFFRLHVNKYIKGLFLFGFIPLLFLTSYSIFFSIPFIWRLTSSQLYMIGFILLVLIAYAYQGVAKTNIHKIQYIVTGWFLVPLLLFFAVSFIIPIFLDRYLIFIMPAFYITVALSVNYLFQSKLSIFLFSILLITLTIFSFNSDISNNRYANDIINQTIKLRTSETKILICPEQYKLTYAYHYNVEYFKDYDNLMLNLNKDRIFPVRNQTELNNILEPLDNIIYIDAHSDLLYPGNGIFDRLNKSYSLTKKIVFRDSTILYEFIKFE